LFLTDFFGKTPTAQLDRQCRLPDRGPVKSLMYREKAREMGKLAQRAHTPELRAEYLRLQQAWLDMADTAERSRLNRSAHGRPE
jgi:hypothetical protein